MHHSTVSSIDAVHAILEGYAERGVFRGFSRGPGSNRKGSNRKSGNRKSSSRKASFRLLWHRDRLFELILDLDRHTLRFPLVLPHVDAKSTMYQKLKEFLKSRQSEEMPQHRRIDTRKARVQSVNRGGNVAVILTIQDGDYEYGARKLVHLVHEIFLVFLVDGPYYESMVETFGLDPDGI